jgi:hypothetical protein
MSVSAGIISSAIYFLYRIFSFPEIGNVDAILIGFSLACTIILGIYGISSARGNVVESSLLVCSTSSSLITKLTCPVCLYYSLHLPNLYRLPIHIITYPYRDFIATCITPTTTYHHGFLLHFLTFRFNLAVIRFHLLQLRFCCFHDNHPISSHLSCVQNACNACISSNYPSCTRLRSSSSSSSTISGRF